VDYASVDSLTAALKGVDAVVSTVGGTAVMSQVTLIHAAVAAGVKRFIPSEYGSVTTNPELESFPIYDQLWKIKRHLKEKSDTGQFTWTVLATGAFTEFLFPKEFVGILDFAQHKATLFDGGDNRITTNSLEACGKAIAAILKTPEATENRVLKISQAILTQNQLLKIAQALKPDDQWEINKISSAEMLQEGLDELQAGKFSMDTVFKVVKGSALSGERFGGAYDQNDNELLGVKELTEKDVEKLVADAMK
jgi:hypothetical protein